MSCLRRMSSKGLYRNSLQGSETLQTVFAINNQILRRDRVAPSHQTLRRMVRQHIDQTIRTLNFQARIERIETGVLVRSQKGKNVSVERKGRMLPMEGERTVVKFRFLYGQRAQSSYSTSRAPTQTDGRMPHKYGNLRGERLDNIFRNRRVTSGTLPCA